MNLPADQFAQRTVDQLVPLDFSQAVELCGNHQRREVAAVSTFDLYAGVRKPGNNPFFNFFCLHDYSRIDSNPPLPGPEWPLAREWGGEF